MVRSVGVREFKAKVTQIIREVEETREPIAVTRWGREILKLVPTQRKMTPEELAAWNARMDALAKEIGKKWPKGVSAADAISEDRSRLDY